MSAKVSNIDGRRKIRQWLWLACATFVMGLYSGSLKAQDGIPGGPPLARAASVDQDERLTQVLASRLQRFVQTEAEDVPFLLIRERNEIVLAALMLRQRISHVLIVQGDEPVVTVQQMAEYTYLANTFNEQIVAALEKAQIRVRSKQTKIIPFYDRVPLPSISEWEQNTLGKIEQVKRLPVVVRDVFRLIVAKNMAALGYKPGEETSEFTNRVNARNFAAALWMIKFRAGTREMVEIRQERFEILRPTKQMINALDVLQNATSMQVQLVIALLENGYWLRHGSMFIPSFIDNGAHSPYLNVILKFDLSQVEATIRQIEKLGKVSEGSKPEFLLAQGEQCSPLFDNSTEPDTDSE